MRDFLLLGGNRPPRPVTLIRADMKEGAFKFAVRRFYLKPDGGNKKKKESVPRLLATQQRCDQ